MSLIYCTEDCIYQKDGKVWNPISAAGDRDIGDITLPASDAYANEINYATRGRQSVGSSA